MVAQTPAKRGMVDGVESEGKKTKDKEQDLGADDVAMGVGVSNQNGSRDQ